MNKSDRNKFLAILETLHTMHDKQGSKVLIDLYWSVMKPYSIEKFTTAVENHISDPDKGMFFPKPADLIKVMQGDTNKAASKAWQSVIRRLERLGDSKPFESSDTAVLEALGAIGGYNRLCTLTYTQINDLEKQFLDSYNETKSAALQLTNEVKKLEH